jgi:hypothetical protein
VLACGDRREDAVVERALLDGWFLAEKQADLAEEGV